jgi:hypothetical protein
MISYRTFGQVFDRARKTRRINPDRRPGHNPDRNGADDGTGAIAASGIRPRGGSSGSDHPHSNRACIVGTPDSRKFEIHHLLWIRWA